MTKLILLLIASMLYACYAAQSSCFVPDALPFPIYYGPNSTFPPCAPGYYCPNLVLSDNQTWPVLCAPSVECAVKRLSLEWCEPQGLYEPTICKAGYYCPIPGQEKLKCPSGHYCPLGTYKPIRCPLLSYCPTGSAEYRQFGLILLLLGVDALVAAIAGLYCFYRHDKHARYLQLLSQSPITSESDLEAAPTESTASIDATQALIGGFHLSRGNQPLLDFDFFELGLSIPGGKKILHGVNGSIRHGQVTAVMGPSGAGKTTFLNTLMGKVDSKWKTEGSLQVNGEESNGLSDMKELIGYVPQEDVMHRELSVWQTLKYSADVRLPREWNDEQRTRHVQAVLDVLDLGKVRNSPIGDETSRGISGGQRKRVNIGMELAACPLALFCDEPTSGLDSASSLSVVSAVKKVARSIGMTVVMVIHQPRIEIWNSLDRVLILAPGGVTAFLGEQRFVAAYFKRHFHLSFKHADNPADIVMDYIAVHGPECARVWKTQGEEWLSEHASSFEPTAEFNDAFADTLSSSLLETRMRRRSAIVSNEELARLINASISSPEVLASPVPHPFMSRPLPPLPTSMVEMEELDPSGKVSPTSPPPRQPLPPVPHPPRRSRKFTDSDDGVFLGEAPNSSEHVVRGANFFFQHWYALVRSLKMQYLSLESLVLELGLALMAGAVIGFSSQLHFQGIPIQPYTTLGPSPELTIIPMKALYIQMAVGIAAASAGVKFFGEGVVVFWREASSGHNRLAYFLATTLSVFPRITLDALHFSCAFQVLSLAYAPFEQMFVNVLLIFYAVYGLACVVSMLVPRKDAPLLAVVVCVIAAVLNGYVRAIPKPVNYVSYAYWSHEALFTAETDPFTHVSQLKLAGDFFHVVRGRVSLDNGLMFGIGTVYRIVGLVLLLLLNRDKQR